jgi:predicted amidophosphoribosyltransferase
MTSSFTSPTPQPGTGGPGALMPWLLRRLPLGWLLQLPCPLCRRSLTAAEASEGLCERCRQRLALPPLGLQGTVPLPWWSSGSYADQLRRTLLSLRREPRLDALRPFSQPLRAALSGLSGQPWLVPIPSWKLRANPLPELLVSSLCQGGTARRAALLERSRPVLGQHHLGRQMRLSNQADSFRCLRPPQPGEARLHPLLIVDDILTTGATACSAAACLEAKGWRVMGLLCLARTPLQAGRDLRSQNRSAQAALPGRDSSVGRAGD